jgi:hypothetical protein
MNRAQRFLSVARFRRARRRLRLLPRRPLPPPPRAAA